MSAEFDSTSRMEQRGHAADTMSRSSAISSAQPVFATGYAVPPCWSTLRKQPLFVVHAGSPNAARYTARSDSAVGESNASTTATTWPAFCAGRPYAAWRSAGCQPAIIAGDRFGSGTGGTFWLIATVHFALPAGGSPGHPKVAPGSPCMFSPGSPCMLSPGSPCMLSPGSPCMLSPGWAVATSDARCDCGATAEGARPGSAPAPEHAESAAIARINSARAVGFVQRRSGIFGGKLLQGHGCFGRSIPTFGGCTA